MPSQRGFIGVLVAVLVGLVALCGGAYYIARQTPSQNISGNVDGLQKQQTNTQTSSRPQAENPLVQTNTSASAAATFSVPGSFTLSRGQTIKQIGDGVSLMFKDVLFADSKTPGEYCPIMVLSRSGVASQTVTICPDNSNYVPYLYQGLSLTLGSSSANSTSFSVSATTQAPLAAIDVSSLASTTITGIASNLSSIKIVIGKTSSSLYKLPTNADYANGNVPVVNGHWSATFKDLVPGTYSVTVSHPSDRRVLAIGSLKIVNKTGTAKFETYTNSQYGFSLQYPNEVKIQTTPVPQRSYGANINNGTVVVTLGQITKTFKATELGWGDNGVVSTFGKLIVGVSTDPTDVKNCMTAPKAFEVSLSNIQTKQINGVSFHSYHIDEPATGLYSTDQTYTTFHNGACYSINAHIDGGASGHMNATDAAANDAVFAQLAAQLDAIAQSFTFQ